MKIKNLAIIILMTIFLIILGTKVEATTGIVNEDAAKLRKQPDSKTVLDLLNEGDEVEILEYEDGWYKVKAKTELGNVTGYVSEELLNVEEENTESKIPEETIIEQPSEEVIELQETTPVVSTEIENVEENKEYTLNQEVGVKALPLINSREKAKISGNVKVIEIINDWARIESDIQIGWIRTSTLEKLLTETETPVQQESQQQSEEIQQEEPTETEPEETTTEEQEEVLENTELNKIGYVSTEGLRVRKGASTDTEEITSLSQNDEVEIIGQTGNWYKINLDGEIGYVSAKYISDTKLPETTSRSGSTLRDDETVVQTSETKETQVVEETPATSKLGTTGAAVVEYAKQYLGYKYISGGASPSTGFDCSGFTTYIYKHFGVSLNRTSGAQINNGVAVEKSDLQPGDLVIFNNDANTKIGHVGIYVGDGNFIHASNPSDGVKITTLTSGYYHKRYVGARRVI